MTDPEIEETLQRLKAQVDSAIEMMKTTPLKKDPTWSALPYDFIIGDFGIVDRVARRKGFRRPFHLVAQ